MGGCSSCCWSYGVMVSTPDSESGDQGSNPGRTSFLAHCDTSNYCAHSVTYTLCAHTLEFSRYDQSHTVTMYPNSEQPVLFSPTALFGIPTCYMSPLVGMCTGCILDQF